MRCTKCSFISFDDLSACAKCASDLSHLSKELNGTCIEARQEFFLGSAIQSSGLDEEGFSDSQALPPIDHSDMNFDDTSTGGFSPISSSPPGASALGLDDSIGVAAEDDVAIELGDIMPIDLDQLDSVPGLSDGAPGRINASSIDNFAFDSNKTDAITSHGDISPDFDLSDFSDSGSNYKFDDDISDIDIDDSLDLHASDDISTTSYNEPFAVGSIEVADDAGFELDNDLLEQLSGGAGNLDETTSLDPSLGFNDTQVSPFAIRNEEPAPLVLDESLVAELTGTTSLDLSGEFPIDFSADSSGSGEFELDAALVAELVGDDSGAYVEPAEVPLLSSENLSAASEVTEYQKNYYGPGLDASSSAHIEDLTGDFPPLRDDEEADLSGLDLADIDVSDLVENSGASPAASEKDNSIGLPEDALVGLPLTGAAVSADDTIRDDGIKRQVLHAVNDDAALGFDEEGLFDNEIDGSAVNEALLVGNKALDVGAGFSGNDLPPLELDFSSFDDTAQEEDDDVGFSGNGLSGMDGSAENVVSEIELSLGHDSEEVELSDDLDPLVFDANFEAFLEKKASVDSLPEIELIPEDEDGPPDIPV